MKQTLSFFAPEVVQTSAMDCGPATLKCLLDGFGIPASYGRLREACQTDVDGTSIDALEDVANQLGLLAKQEMAPVDHLFLDEQAFLPALVVSTLPNGNTHFVVIWRTLGPFVQVMDPAIGRRWLPQQQFLRQVYRHRQPVVASDWRQWAGGEGFLALLRQRLKQLGVTPPISASLLATASNDPTWRSLATLDAAIRLVAAMCQGNGVRKGQEAEQLLSQLFSQAQQTPAEATTLLPSAFWSVQASNNPSPAAEEEHIILCGAVFLHIAGQQTPETPLAALSPELSLTLTTTSERPLWELWRTLRSDGVVTPLLVIIALALAAAGASVELLLLRGLVASVGVLPALTVAGTEVMGAGTEVMTWMVLLLLLAGGLLVLEAGLAAALLRSGRRLETRLRIALLTKLARLGDHYFHSRLLSDTTLRAYELVALRTLPTLGATFLRTGFQLLFTIIGLALLAPSSLPVALGTLLVVVAITLLTAPHLSERDMRVRTHASALNGFYLDGLLGLLPLQTHSAERALRRQQEGLLVEWVQALTTFQQSARWIQFATALLGMGAAIYIIFVALAHGSNPSNLLLLLYWALNLPVLAQSFVDLAMQYPTQRNRILRLLEPLHAPEEEEGGTGDKMTRWQDDKMTRWQGDKVNENPPLIPSSPHPLTPSSATAIHLENVSVHAGGHTILHDLNLQIAPGEHVAIVGVSGAGKSSLLGLLLGWQRAATGQVWVDGELLHGEHLQRLRRQTAWVDPAVQLWNRTLLENLLYGTAGAAGDAMQQAMANADLFHLLESLPSGLQTQLGEGGGLVSGGEGQRVRLGRALLRPSVRLALLDEPFRGLDRGKRRQLLQRARQHWQAATLLCITHDVGEILDFPRLLVLEGGRIVEEGDPRQLAADATSHYRRMLDAEQAVQQGLWEGSPWRRLWMEKAELVEKSSGGA